MPTYTFKNKETGELTTDFMSISAMEAFISENQHLEVLCGAPLVHSGRGKGKPDDGFRDVLRRIKKGSGKNNTINTF